MMQRCLGIMVLAVAVLAFHDLRAAPLDAATCGMLKGERAQLESSGVRDSMVKGPEWAKVNLAPEKLDRIRRLLHIDEQLLFRCAADTLVELPPDADADPAAKSPGEPRKDAPPGEKEPSSGRGKDKAQPAAPQARRPASRKAAAPPNNEGSGTAAARKSPRPTKEQNPPRASAKPNSKPKKADDAYKPLPPDPKANPFSGQLRQ